MHVLGYIGAVIFGIILSFLWLLALLVALGVVVYIVARIVDVGTGAGDRTAGAG